jgi:hypothetical protein
MPAPVIEVRGLTELIQRMQQYPQKLAAVVKTGMDATLAALWESVPPYPASPPDSTYRRTGTLGRTLGSSFSGGKSGGEPSIYSTRSLGAGNIEGRFGTNLDYAPYVIGDGTQAKVHQGRWWTMTTIAEKAKSKITAVWNSVGTKLANFLDGKEVL